MKRAADDAKIPEDDSVANKKQRMKTRWDTNSKSLSKKLSLQSVVGNSFIDSMPQEERNRMLDDSSRGCRVHAGSKFVIMSCPSTKAKHNHTVYVRATNFTGTSVTQMYLNGRAVNITRQNVDGLMEAIESSKDVANFGLKQDYTLIKPEGYSVMSDTDKYLLHAQVLAKTVETLDEQVKELKNFLATVPCS